MKNEAEELTIDQYRLQLTRLSKEEESLGLNQQDNNAFSIYNIRQLPKSISNITPWVYFSFQYFWLLHLTLCYLVCFQKVYQKQLTWATDLLNYVNLSNTIGYIINAPLLILAIISIVFRKQEKEEGILAILGFVGGKTIPFLRYIIAFLLYSTSIFALGAQTLSIVLFVLSCLVVLVEAGLLKNFTLRKDEFCCKSPQFLLLDRTITIVSISLGITAVNVVTTENQLLVFVIFQTILGVIAIVCYFSFGVYTFRHKVPRFLFFFLNVSYCALSFATFFDVLQSLGNGSFNFFAQAFFALLVGVYLSYNTLDRKRRLSQVPQNKNLKEKIYFLFNKFQSCDIDNQDDCQLRGLLNFHHICGCSNPQCAVNFQEVYDAKKKKFCSIKKIAQSRVSLVKFYVKCLFETALEQDPQNAQILLDYLQFYYLKLKNVFVVLKLILELQKKLLSPIQRLRLVRLKRILKEENNSFSEDLFMGKLSMEKVIGAEQTFETLVKGIDLVLLRNQLFWKYIARNQVFLCDILQVTKSNFSLVDRLDEKWHSIANYFQINRRWKFYFLCFTIYIKNEKLKPSMFEDLGNSVEYDSIFKSGNYFIDKTTEKEALFNPIMLYQQNTCYIVANCDQQKMQIKRVSNYFYRSFEYQPNEIIGSHLHELMPPSIKSFHHKMFVNWAKEGKNRNQNLYSVKKVTPLTKKGYLAPCFKFYKYYVLNNSEIQYIAMLKRNKQEEMMILTNQKFEIEAITYGLAQKLRIISTEDYRFVQGINLLIMIPMLAKYTYYAKYLNQNDEDFLENDDNQNYFKKQSTFVHGGNQQTLDILGIKKQLNLTNLKLIIPTDFEGMKYEMKSKSKERKDEFAVIRECYALMRKKKNFLKFKGEICIRQKDYSPYSSSKFYEIEINELEENNRLEKMKLQQQKIEQLNEAQSSRQIQSSVMMEVDMQMFLQLNKKKNRVVLFPSDNIFIKEQSNQALTQVSHIQNISISIRLILAVLVTALLVMLIVQIVAQEKIKVLNKQFYWISDHQKMSFLLNSQYNMQQMQLGNEIEQSFYIIFYTHSIIHASQDTVFQVLLYDTEVNPQQLLPPYFQGKYPYPILQNISCLPQDQVSIFEYLYQSIITLHRMAEQDPTNRLECQQYHIFNNYIYSYYTKSQQIKTNLIKKYQNLSKNVSNLISWLGISQIILIVFCFLFSLSRLVKVTRGFFELMTIFIQMDNNDIRKISRFVGYVINLFDHLKEKYNKMKDNRQCAAASASYIRELQKPSSQLGKTEQMMAASVGANLNKKIKKLEVGNEISSIKRKTICLLAAYLLFLGLTLSIPVIYSLRSLSQLNELENMGFTLISHNSVPNSITTGILQRFRNASIYRADKYTPFMKELSDLMENNVFLTLSSYDHDFAKLIKLVYYEDFCNLRSDVFNSTFKENLEQTCGSTHISVQNCQVLFNTITDISIANRCKTIQSSFLTKGVVTFYNYLMNRGQLYFNNGSVLTLNDIVEINDALKIVAVFDVYLSHTWLNYTKQKLSSRLIGIIVVIVLSFILSLILHFVFVEVWITNYLNQNYQIFRRMHQYLIPEFVINKQKIIKVKLIKQGFMKQ